MEEIEKRERNNLYSDTGNRNDDFGLQSSTSLLTPGGVLGARVQEDQCVCMRTAQ